MNIYLIFESNILTGNPLSLRFLISFCASVLVKNPLPSESKVPSGELQIKYGKSLSSILIKNLFASILCGMSLGYINFLEINKSIRRKGR